MGRVMNKVIKGGTIVTADREWKADILIEGEAIKQIGPNLFGDEVIDAEGKFVLPAFCDSHTHTVFAQAREEEFVDRINGLTYEDIALKGGGILNSARRLQEMSEDELFSNAKKRIERRDVQGRYNSS